MVVCEIVCCGMCGTYRYQFGNKFELLSKSLLIKHEIPRASVAG
jgi:hypothetical protein